MFCEKCGAPISEAARFCAACGAAVTRPDMAETASTRDSGPAVVPDSISPARDPSGVGDHIAPEALGHERPDSSETGRPQNIVPSGDDSWIMGVIGLVVILAVIVGIIFLLREMAGSWKEFFLGIALLVTVTVLGFTVPEGKRGPVLVASGLATVAILVMAHDPLAGPCSLISGDLRDRSSVQQKLNSATRIGVIADYAVELSGISSRLQAHEDACRESGGTPD